MRHRPNDKLLEPGRQGFGQLGSYLGLSIDVVNVGGTSWTIVFGEGRNCAVVQQFDPFGGSVYAIALVNGEQGKAVVLFIARQHMLSGFFLEFS